MGWGSAIRLEAMPVNPVLKCVLGLLNFVGALKKFNIHEWDHQIALTGNPGDCANVKVDTKSAPSWE